MHEKMALLSLNAKSLSFSPYNIYPLRKQMRSTVPRNSSIWTITKVGENHPFNSRSGEIHAISKRLSFIVRAAAATLDSDDGGNDALPATTERRRRRRRRSVFWVGKLKCLDMAPGSPEGAVVFVLMHLVCVIAPFCFSWNAFGVASVLSIITGLGITLSYHRNLCHRSFKLPKWLEYLFAYCAVHALQGTPIGWVSTHRHHHQNCDSERDPHSPIQGFWYSHMGWLFDFNSINERREMPSNVGDLEKQFFYRFIQFTYVIHPIVLATLLYAIGGFPYVVWGMGVRVVLVYHITFLVNSACHVWGNQTWNTGDLSRNNWLVALLTFGEGWHNNHHAFEFSARHGLEWWQFDLTWYIIWILRAFGLATDVKLPTNAQKRMVSFNKKSRYDIGIGTHVYV